MPDLFAYLEGFGTGESFTKSVIIVTDLPTGATVTATKGETAKTATEKDGKWWLRNLDIGEWTLTAKKSILDATKLVNGGTIYGITVTPRGDGTLSYVGTASRADINVWMYGSYNVTPGSRNVLFTIPSGTKVIAKDCWLFSVNDGNVVQIPEDREYTASFDFKVTGVRAPQAVVGVTYDKIIKPSVQVIEGEAETATTKFNIERFGVYYVPMSFFKATIQTKYPVGSTCTCSKGDKTFTAPDTSGQYDFVVDSAGEWTVSCTDGADKQDSEVAEITENGQTVEVSLSYEVELYNSGDTCDSVTGGWKSYSGSVNFGEKSATVTVSQQGGNCVAGTVNKVDVTGKKSLNIIVDSATTEGGYSLYLSDSQKASSYADIVTNAIAHLTIKGKGNYSLDIQNVNKEAYVGFGGAQSSVQSMVFSRVWLE